MSGGGFRGRGFGPHGPRYISPGSGRQNDNSGNGSRHRGNYSRGNYNNSQLPPPSFSSQSGPSRRNDQQQENWSQSRSYARWDQPSTIQGNNQLLNWPQNRRESFQNSSVRYSYHSNASYHSRSGRGHFRSNNGGGSEFRFTEHRGSNNYYNPPYYNAPYKENTLRQQEPNIIPDEPVPPLLGSEEERQQKITEAADELKRKLLTNRTIPQEESNWYEDFNIDSMTAADKEANTIKAIPELKHGPPELKLTLSDFKDIGRVDIDNTIDPSATESNLIAKVYDITETDSVHHNRNHSDEEKCNNPQKSPLITLEYTSKTIDLDSDNVTKEPTKKLRWSSEVGSKNVIKIVNPSKITEDSIFNRSKKIIQDFNVVEIDDNNKKYVDLEKNSLNAIDDKSLIKIDEINMMKNITIDNSPNLNQSPVQHSFNSCLITLTESVECNLEDSLQKSNPKNILSRNVSKTTNKSKTETSEHGESEQQIHLSCQEEEIKSKKNEKMKISSAHNKRNINKESSKPTLIFDPRKPPPLVNQSFTKNEEILQPPPAFDPRRDLSTIVPEFDPQMPPPILSNQTDAMKSFNAHLSPMPSIIPSTPATGAPISIPSTMPSYGHPSYNPMVPYVPAVSMPYSQVITPVEYPLAQMSQPPLPLSTVNNSLSVGRVANKPDTNGDPNLSVDDVLGEMKEAMEFAKQCMVMGEDEDVLDFPTLPNLPPLPEFKEHSKNKPTTKQKKTKKTKQESCYGPHPKPSAEKIQEASKELTLASIRLPEENSKLSLEKNKISEVKNKFLGEKVKCYDEENPGDDLGRRKVMFNLSAKFKKLNKTEEWMNEAMEDEVKQKNRRLKILSLPAVAVVAPTTMTSTIMSEQKNDTSREETSSELVKDSSSSENSNQKNKELTETINKNKEKESVKRDSKKQNDKVDTHDHIQRKAKKSNRAQLTSGSKPEKYDSNNEFIAEKISEAKTYTHKLSSKKTTPALTESSWKNRVITRFLKMSKNDIQNMINNSSLRKFDIAMQHLVKEKKSSLSMEMRLNEHEKMKNSNNYNNEDFMSQLQAILDPAATVDITNLPTTFLHQLSEVLHLDPLPPDLEDSSDKSEPQISLNQESSLLKIDKSMFVDSLLCPETDTAGSSTYDMSNPEKIDKQFIDMTKHTYIMDTSTYSRTRNKCNEVDTNIQRSASSNTITSMYSASNVDNLNMDDLDDIFVAGIRAKAKSTVQSSTNSPTTTNERISTTMPVKKIETIYTENDQIPTAELDEIFSAVLAKTKTFSMKNTASTSMEALEREQSHILHQELHNNSGIMSSWKRKGIDDPDNFRNLTKEEYEARYGDFSGLSNEDDNRLMINKTQKIMPNGREMTPYLTQSNKNYISYTPPDIHSINNPIDSDDGSVSGLESSSSTSSSSASDEESLDVSKVLRFIKEREKIAKKKSINEEIRDEVSAEIEKKRREKNAKHKSYKSKTKRKEKKKKEKDRKGKKKKLKKKRKRRHHSPLSNISDNENEERPLWLLREDEIKKEPPEEILKEEAEEIMEEHESENQVIHLKTTSITPTCSTPSTSVKNNSQKVSTTAIQTSSLVSPRQSLMPNTIPINTNSIIPDVMKTSPTSPLTTFSSKTNTMSCSSSTHSSQSSPLPHMKTKAQLKQMPEVLSAPKMDQPTSPKTQLPSDKETINNQICIEKTNVETSSKIIPATTVVTTKMTTTAISSIAITTPSTIITSTTTTTTAVEKNTTLSTSSGPRKLDIKQYKERAHRRKLLEQEKGRAIAENPSVLTQDLLKLPTLNKISTECDTQSNLMTSLEPFEPAANLLIDVTRSLEVPKILQKLPPKTTYTCETFTSTIKTSSSQNIEESKFANIKSEGSKEMKLKEKLKRKPMKPVITDIKILKNNTLSPQSKKLKIGPKSFITAKTLNINEEIVTSRISCSTSVPSISSTLNNTKILDEEKTCINIEIDQQNKFKHKVSELNNEKDVEIKEPNISQTNSAEMLNKMSVEVASKNTTALCEKINVHNKVSQKFSHYFTSSKHIQSDGFPDTVTFEIMDTKKQNIITKKFNDKSTLPSNEINKDFVRIDDENTTNLSLDLKKLLNPVLDEEMKEEMDGSSVCSVVQPISINLQLEENTENEDKIFSVNNRTKNLTSMKKTKEEEMSLEKPVESEEYSIEEITLTNKSVNKVKAIEIRPVTNEEESEKKEESPSNFHFQEFEKLSSTLSANSKVHLTGDIIECNTLLPSEEIKIINSFERITSEEFTDISDGELINEKIFSENPLPEINSLSETSDKQPKELILRETKALSKTGENSEILTSDTSDWNVVNMKTENEIDLIPEEIINQSSHEQELESSLLRVPALNTYEAEDMDVSFSSKSVVLHDKVLTADNVRNSFLDDPIAFSNTKSPTPETMEFGILGDADIVGSIYNNQLDETTAIDSIEDVSTDEPFRENERVCTLALPVLETPCLPSETDDNFILSQNSSEQINDSDFPDKELIKEIEVTSPERLLSPILQIPTRLSDDNDDDLNSANDIDIDKHQFYDSSKENITTIIITTNITEGVINSKSIYPEFTAPIEHHIEPTSDISKKNLLTVDLDINNDKNIQLSCLNNKSDENFSERDKIEESLEEILSGNPSKYAQMSPTIEESILNIVEEVQTEGNINYESVTGNIINTPLFPEISIPSKPESQTPKKEEKCSSKDDPSRKSSRSKSCTPPRDQKKNKKRHHHHHRKKSKLSAEKVEEAITADIVKPISITKDSVMMRMQEIDLTIQKLMDEKMTLYQMLKDDKWPSVQTEEHPTLTEQKIPKIKNQLFTSLTDKLTAKSPRVVVSRLAGNDIKQASTSSVIERSQSKSEHFSTPKHEGLLLNKFSKLEEKINKASNSNEYIISKISKKRKYKEDKDHNKNKDLKKDGFPGAKRQMHSEVSLHKHKKLKMVTKNIGESSRKTFKLSQLLKNFKPKIPVERRSTSPKELNRIQKPSSISTEKNVHISNEFLRLSKNNDLNNTEKEEHKESFCNEKNKPCLNNENNTSFQLSKKLKKEHLNNSEDSPNLIYSDDSTWDHADRFQEKSERPTGLLLLEESMKREKAAKKSKYLLTKKKISNSNLKEDSISSDFDDTIPLAHAIPKKKLKKKQSITNKKCNKSSSNDENLRTEDHTEEIIDAVATNRVKDLYENSMTKDNDQGGKIKEKSFDKLLKTIEKSDSINIKKTGEISNEIEKKVEVVDNLILEDSTKIDNSEQTLINNLNIEMKEKNDFHLKTSNFVQLLQATQRDVGKYIEKNNPDETEWTTLDSVGFIDEKDDGLEDISDDRLEIHTSFEEEASNISSADILEKSSEETTTVVPSPKPIEEVNVDNIKSDDKTNDHENNQKLTEIQSTILQDWAESPSQSTPYDNDINSDMEKSRFDLNQVMTREILIINTCEKTSTSNIEVNIKEQEIDETNINESQKLIIDCDNNIDQDSVSMEVSVESMKPAATKDKNQSDNEIDEQKTEKEMKNDQNEKEALKKRKSSLEREIERPKSAMKELGKYKYSSEEPVRSKSAVKELENLEYTIEEIDNERQKSTIKEIENQKSAVEEIEISSSLEEDIGKPKSSVKDLEILKVKAKEFEINESTIKDFNKTQLIIVTEAEKLRTQSKIIKEKEPSDERDIYNDENTKRKREKSNKTKYLSASRRSSRSSRQSDDNSRTSRSRSRSARVRKSSNSRDVSSPEMDLKGRPASGGSSSSSVSNKRKSITNSRNRETIKTDFRSTRWKRKKKILDDSVINLMRKCKVELIDCKRVYCEPSLYFKFLQLHGLSRINNWIFQEVTPDQGMSLQKSDKPSISDEDKNHSDDDSMELIQVEETDDLQTMDTLNSLADDSIQDSRDQNDNNSSISLEFTESPQNVDIAGSDFDEYHDNDEEPEILESDIEILEDQSPTVNTSTFIHSENTESDEPRRTQYTVHKGPILDIKVFGDSFLAASEDGAIYRYSQRSNGILNIYKGHDAAVTCLYIHEVPGTAESGNTRWNLFSGSLDATLRCYDIINGSLDRHISEIGSPIQCMDQAWGSIFIGTKSGHISRYDIKSGCLREDKLDFSDKPILALRASTEGPRKILIVASRNQPITIRDAQNGLFLRTISGQRNHTVYSLLMDKNLVYCGTSNTSIPVFDFISGEQVVQYTAGVGIVCMRLYKQLLFAGCYDGNIYVFDTNDTKLICSIPGPGNMLLSLEIVNDEIIAGSKDRRLHAWKMPNQIRNIIADQT